MKFPCSRTVDQSQRQGNFNLNKSDLPRNFSNGPDTCRVVMIGTSEHYLNQYSEPLNLV